MITFSLSPSLAKRKKAELLAIPFWRGEEGAEPAAPMGDVYSAVSVPLSLGDFKGEEGQVVLLYASEISEQRIVLLGLGRKDGISVEKLRRVYSTLTKLCHSKGLHDINLLMVHTTHLKEEEVSLGIAEGLLLANYTFSAYKTPSALNYKPPRLLEKVALIGASKIAMREIATITPVIEGVYLARDLANGNADKVTPQHLIEAAMTIGRTTPKVKVSVFDKKRLTKEKMGLLLAVGRGAVHDPAMIFLSYKGDPKSTDHTVLVGKGVTFDTGGLNLKGTGNMETMKGDMAAAAAFLGVIHAVASLNMKSNVTVIIPTAENAIDANSFKPGDVYTSYNGTTVEVGNTDAEGRLILADAIAYAVKNLKPSRIIDAATLTGACVVALGDEVSGMMSNRAELTKIMQEAGDLTFERVWSLPLHEEYREYIKSDIADLKNIGGRAAGAVLAAKFIQHFVGNTPWVHLDVAGPAFLDKEKRYHPKGGSGIPVRLLVKFLHLLATSKK